MNNFINCNCSSPHVTTSSRRLISGTVHLARIKMRNAQKKIVVKPEGENHTKAKCLNERVVVRPIMKLRNRSVAPNGPVVDSYAKNNEFQSSIGVKSGDKLKDCYLRKRDSVTRS